MTHSFVPVVPGNLIHAQDLNQVINALDGLAAAGVPIVLTALSDPSNFALVVQNQESSNSRALLVLKSDGTQLVRVDVNGVTLGAPLNLAAQSVNGTALLNASVPNAALGPDVARANLLTNGGFEIWQRGNGPFITNGAYAADRWLVNANGTISVSKDTTNNDTASQACAAVTFTYVGTSYIVQPFADSVDGGLVYQLRGKTITFSCRVRTANAAAVRVGLFGTSLGRLTTGQVHTGDGTYQTLAITATVPTNETTLQVEVQLLASCTAYLDNANLVVGSQPANYVPLHPADDLARCLRYYEVLGIGSDLIISGIATAASQTVFQPFTYRAMKPVTPTVTLGSWSGSNCSAAAFNAGSTLAMRISTASIAAGAFFSQNSGSVTVEANP